MKPVRISTKKGERLKVGPYDGKRVCIGVFTRDKNGIVTVTMTPAEALKLIAALEKAVKEMRP